MAHAKRCPLQHVMEDESVKVLQRPLPKEWVLRSYHRDYGINYIIELFNYVDEEHRWRNAGREIMSRFWAHAWHTILEKSEPGTVHG